MNMSQAHIGNHFLFIRIREKKTDGIHSLMNIMSHIMMSAKYVHLALMMILALMCNVPHVDFHFILAVIIQC